MTGAQRPSVQLPLPRPHVLDLAPQYRALRSRAPLTRVLTPTDQPAWLVTAYEEAREVFADSSRFGLHAPAAADEAPKALDGNGFERDIARLHKEIDRHMARQRQLLLPFFTARRMKSLAGRIQELTDGCLDAMAAAHDRQPDRPVNFHELVGFRLPGLVICELLGVPDADRDELIALSDRMGSTADGADAMAAMVELGRHAKRLLAAKRATPGEPGDDVFSFLLAAQDADPVQLSDSDLTHYAMGLVSPGHEPTMARMDFGVLYLLSDPSRRDWLAADIDGRLDDTVEEILRMTAPHHLGLPRYAQEDVEVGGVAVGRGDLVIVSEAAANRDPAVFEDPDTFAPGRTPNGHIAFGHGPRHCIGQHLARTELRILFGSLFRRFPGLRLAGDIGELEILEDRIGGGVANIPVTW